MSEGHTPRVITRRDVRAKMRDEGGLNTRIAVFITRIVGNMWTAYIFTALSIVGLLGLLGLLNPFTFLLCTWVSQMFLQLVFLPILSVGQNVLGHHQEMLSEESYKTTNKTYSDIERVLKHLDAQDTQVLDMAGKIEHIQTIMEAEVLKQSDAITVILEKLDAHEALLKTLSARGRSKVHD